MVRIVRHRQTKGPATDGPNLTHRATSRLLSLKFHMDGEGVNQDLDNFCYDYARNRFCRQ
jgi:hypothetical protein